MMPKIAAILPLLLVNTAAERLQACDVFPACTQTRQQTICTLVRTWKFSTARRSRALTLEHRMSHPLGQDSIGTEPRVAQ